MTKSRCSFVFLLAMLLFGGSHAAASCNKAAFGETTLQKYEASKLIVIARGISVEKVKEGEDVHSLFGVKSIKMSVEKVFKGDLKISDEIVLIEGTGRDDVDSFRESDVGRSYLLFLCSPKREPNIFQVMRAKNHWLPDEKASELRYHENDAARDLLYLEKLDERRGRTRIYGKLWTNQDSYSEWGQRTVKSFRNVKVTISGNGKTYETTTNEDGIFEIYDLPAGEYTIFPDIPKGWQISDVSTWGTGEGDLRQDSRVRLKAGRHAFYNYHLEWNTIVSGKLSDPTGAPMRGVCLEILPVAGKYTYSFFRAGCTNEQGVFNFPHVVGGEYVIVANKDGVISSTEPFPSVFYPNVFERDKAKLIKVVDGENQTDIDIRIPKVSETVTVSGSVRSADGVPVVRAFAEFLGGKTDKKIDGFSYIRTDEEGRFSIKILKGLEGMLSGSVIIDRTQFRACPEILKLMDDKGYKYMQDEKTNAVKIRAERDLKDVELKLKLPSCKKEKLISLTRVD